MSAESDQRQADLENAEREMQRYLGGDSPLSEKYRAHSRETTPPHLDSAVLAHAREQLQSAFDLHRGPAMRRRHRRWAVPLATAATMLVGVNLVWQMRDQAVPEMDASVAAESMESAAPMSAPMAAPEVQAQAQVQVIEQRDAQLAVEQRVAEAGRQLKAERAPSRAAAPTESFDADAEAGAMPELAASAEAPAVAAASAPDPVRQPALADASSEPQAKRKLAAQAEREEARSADRLAAQTQQRADSAPPARERKALAASGFAGTVAPLAVPAPAPVAVADPAQVAALDLLRYLRAGDLSTIRIEFNAAGLGSDMLGAAARAAKTMVPEIDIKTSTAGDGLWRFDYRDASQGLRIVAMLQQSGTEWMLLSVDAGGD